MIDRDRGQQGQDTLRKGDCRLLHSVTTNSIDLVPASRPAMLEIAHMIEIKLHLISNSTPVEAVICVLEDTRRSIVSRNHGEPGFPVRL